MIKRLLQNWKTTSTGLTMIIGSVVHLVFAVRAHTADENTWTVSLGVIVGGLGLLFASDGSRVNTIAKVADKTADAVNKINQEGSSTDTQILLKTTSPPKE